MSSSIATRGGTPSPQNTVTLALGSVGVVYGDIGTSPLYALREGLAAGTHGGLTGPEDVIGIVSLLLWLLILIASYKYVVLILRADNRGEGGTLSLLALCQGALGGRRAWLLGLGIAGTALFFGDAMITPAISVLSAVEGGTLVAPGLEPLVVPITLGILLALFWAQRRGIGGVSRLFGPVMLVWFLTIGGLGLGHVADAPRILAAFSPVPGITYLFQQGSAALPVIGSVFLAITGAEALYADMGHFGRRPIRLAWMGLVFPALTLSYLGQGAMVLGQPHLASDPFFYQAPAWALPLLVALATMATVIASQAVITGAFSFAHQAVQLGLLPRMAVRHTSETQEGQIFLPRVNVLLASCVILLMLGFGSSARLAGAYGIAVTGEMLITSLLALVVFRLVWRWSLPFGLALILPLIAVEVALLAAAMTKFTDGGWLPVGVALLLVLVMATWVRMTAVAQAKSTARSTPLTSVIASLEGSSHLGRAPGTAVFLTAEPVVAPPALLHNLKHNHVLHERNLIVTVVTANRPHMPPDEMVTLETLSPAFTRVTLKFGYMDRTDVPRALRSQVRFDIMKTSFFLNRRTFKLVRGGGLPEWEKMLFAFLSRTTSSASDFYHLPSDRVVELGQLITL